MSETIEESKCLASLAVFRELYNSEKDIYGIISEFITEVILSSSKHSFNLTEITNLLNDTYDFSIPEAVIRTSLNRVESLSKERGIYSIDNLAELKSKNINIKKDQIQSNNDKIIQSLFEFVSGHKEKELAEKEKTDLVHSFITFLIDGANSNKYSELISAFIIGKQDDASFKVQLSTIKEGIVLYTGIKYNTNLNEIGSWKNDFTIFIETEILFHLAGYNGQVYQKLSNDFFNYVNEINRRHPNRIKLRYFSEVKDEIERFFKKAEYIVEGKDKANPRVTAMMTIVDGCDSKADVVGKKADFFSLLKSALIKEDDYNEYFSEHNHKYNIVDQNVINRLAEDLGIEAPSEYLRFLNYVSIHRKDTKENNFDNIRYILLSGNSKTIQIAWNENVKAYGQVPLATTLSFLTNKFWFKLNKGFGNGKLPLTFDVITKAQIVLSNQINESVGQKFEELQTKYRTGAISEDQAKASIIELRKQAKKPEDVVMDNVEAILDGISEDSIETFLKEQEHFKKEAAKQSEENSILRSNLSQKEIEIQDQLKEHNKVNLDLLEAKRTILNEKENSKRILENQKAQIDLQIRSSIRNHKMVFLIVLIGAFMIVHYLILHFGWNNSEQWAWILFYSIPLFFSLIYMVFTEKTVNPVQLIERRKNRIRDKMYRKSNFDKSQLDKLSNEIDALEKEIKV
ncbi:hypothetical protein KFE98_00425 [bacterium SCSIO 12741]|nr:hypothetical protein KFE98_00425 [bacterium SCSIO 12741]